MSEQKNYFKANTNKVLFQKAKISNKDALVSSIVLTNLTDQYILFKVYINKQQGYYSIAPSTSFIAPKGEAFISIKRLEGDEGNDTFLISGYPTNTVITSVSI